MVYAVADIPNDAEENMFWRLCRQFRNDAVVTVTQHDDCKYLKAFCYDSVVKEFKGATCLT